MRSALETYLEEPRADNPPRRVWRDAVVVGAVWIGVGLEVLLRSDLRSAWGAAAFVAALSLSLLWRRTEPLLSFVAAFGGMLLVELTLAVVGLSPLDIFSGAFLLILMYSLFRWGSGKEMAIGSGLALVLFVVSIATSYTGASDIVGGFIILEFPAATGLAVRYIRRSRAQAREQIRVGERERIARELHDTMAHHISAIAIQAQAGRFVAEAGSLDGAVDALETIEEEASRTLDGMRSLVGTLRDVEASVSMAPQHTIVDVDGLAATTSVPVVKVSVADDALDVGLATGAAVYRIVQESITNARRHARNATAVEVLVEAGSGEVTLTVTDDGDPSRAPSSQGFGLTGMVERATLLGGSLEAGPAPTRGWLVRAVLPADFNPREVR